MNNLETSLFDDDDYIPGTEDLQAEEERILATHDGVVKRDGDVLLIPQPSDSVNDPLNWNKSRKYWHFFLLMLITGFTAATSNDAGAAQNSMNEELGISWNAMNAAAGVLFVGIGSFTLIFSPFAFLYGRKITYLLCILFGLAGSVWFARIYTTPGSIGNQFFVGISEACAEAQVQLSLSDMFFQHQLGSVIGAYILATSIGTYLGPLIAGYIADGPGWKWVPWSAVIISGALMIVLVFGLEETYFDRTQFLKSESPTPSIAEDSSKAILNLESSDKSGPVLTNDGQLKSDAGNLENGGLQPDKPYSYWKRIALITPATNLKGTGFFQYVKRLILTLRVFLFPPVLYSGLQWGAQDAWLTFYLTTEDEIWIESPWNYGDAAVSVMNVPTLIGAVIGCLYGGPLSDMFVVWMARRNGNIREPEHRLWLMFLTAIISPLGMFLFGIGTARGYSWPMPYIGLGLIGFGWGCAGDLSMSYLMDAYPGMVLEGMVGVSVINNGIGCLFTFFCQDWLDNLGTENSYIVIGVLDFVFMMFTVPMIFYGKRCRKFTKNMYKSFLEARDGM